MKRGGPLQRRTPLKAGKGLATTGHTWATPERPRKRVAAMSPKREKANAERRLVVAQLLRESPRCQLRWACRGDRAIEVHERLKRSRGGSITDPEQAHMVTTCRRCHELTESEPAEAERRRALLPSWHVCPPIGPC